MSRALITLQTEQDRSRAVFWISEAPAGTRVEFKAPKRSLDQNSKMWAMLTDVAEQLVWHGKKLKTDDWKLVFIDALKQEHRIVPNIHETGFVTIGTSSSDLSKEEMAELLDLIAAFGAQHGVEFHEV